MAGTLVQSKRSSGTGTSAVIAFDSNVTAASSIIVGVAWNDTAQTASISDSLLSAFNADATKNHSTNSACAVKIYSTHNSAGGADTITVTFSASVTWEMEINEVSGLQAASTLDVSTTAENTAVTTHPHGTASTAQAEEFLFAIGRLNLGPGTYTKNGSMTNGNMVNSRTSFQNAIVSSLMSSYDANFTTTNSRASGCAWTSYKVQATDTGEWRARPVRPFLRRNDVLSF